MRLPVAERIAAGKVGVAIEPGTCARIFTGAPMPEGADTVVPQEEVEREGDLAVFRTAPKKGAWVRRQGSDVAAGSVILKKGVRMTPGAIGMTASIGRAPSTASSGSGSSSRATNSCSRENPFVRAASTTRTAS